MTSARRAARYGTPEPVDDGALPEWRRFAPDDERWDRPDDAGEEPMLRRMHRRRRWEAARDDWGRANGFDPTAKCADAEGKRWWEFLNGGPIGTVPIHLANGTQCMNDPRFLARHEEK